MKSESEAKKALCSARVVGGGKQRAQTWCPYVESIINVNNMASERNVLTLGGEWRSSRRSVSGLAAWPPGTGLCP